MTTLCSNCGQAWHGLTKCKPRKQIKHPAFTFGGKSTTRQASTAAPLNAVPKRKVHHNLALVYQAGIANVFSCERLQSHPTQSGHITAPRNATLLFQHAFMPCEYFVKGAIAAGAICVTYSCNRAGDIAGLEWAPGLSDCPFRNQATPPEGTA